jgi:acylphosphatase
MNVRAHVLVNGRVQGVFFRSETQIQAKKLDVKGWIRNLADGRVEAVFEGEDGAVKKLIDFCRRGPPGAKVTSVNVLWETYTGDLQSFDARGGLEF